MKSLLQIIKKDIRHQDYDRVVHLAKTYTRLATGVDMAPLMRRFNRRETESAFKQRILITQHITKAVFQNLIKPAYKVPRSNGVQRILAYTDDTENQKKKELEAILAVFNGDDSLDSYMEVEFILQTHVDPNAFVVVEWGEFNPNIERAQPYPFEVSSEEAVYYEFINNILQTLVVRQEYQEDNISEEEDGETILSYTKYNMNDAIRMTRVNDKKLADKIKEENVEVRFKRKQEDGKFKSLDFIKLDGKNPGVYLIERFPYKLGFVPAIRTGYKKDLVTKNRTMVSAIDEAVPVLMKIVKANSELDLTMALHAFPQKLQFVPSCRNKTCHQGKLPDGNICGECKGEGWSESVSAQEVISIEMPKNKEDIIDIEKLIHYESPPVDLIKFQDQYVKDLTAQSKDAVFNSDIFSRQEVAETATGKNIDIQNVYDTLWPLAKSYRKSWNFFVGTVAKITSTDKNLIFDYIFNRDFKMKSLNDLYNDLKVTSDSKADEFVKRGIQGDIAVIMYADNQNELLKFKTMEAFFPYSGKRPEEILFIVINSDVKDPHRVLWESYGWIFDDIVLEQGKAGKNFYEMKKSVQKKILDKKVQEIIAAMPDEKLILNKPEIDV